jgi:hypothetical protein
MPISLIDLKISNMPQSWPGTPEKGGPARALRLHCNAPYGNPSVLWPRLSPKHSSEVLALSANTDPKHHVQKMEQRLREIRDHLREDIGKVDEPQFKAMFETSAEVLSGLVKAFNDYEKKNESAWTRTQKETRGVTFGP